MYPFTITKAKNQDEAVSMMAGNSRYIGGGTNLVDLMKMNVEKPSKLIDITGLELKKIEQLPNGDLRIGALVSNTALAYHPSVTSHYPLLSKAILAGASPQLRNMATVAGNILQRTRCSYFYDTVSPCNKRHPGSGCSAINGYNRMHAVLGTSEQCIATHPSDMCVALAALDAVIFIYGPAGIRSLPFSELHLLPGSTPWLEHALTAGELITHIQIPAAAFMANSTYVKIRDRSSYEFALASAAVALDIDAGHIKNARIALGGVATKPWRAREAETFLLNKVPSQDNFKQAASIALQGAKTLSHNAYKPELCRRAIINAFKHTGG